MATDIEPPALDRLVDFAETPRTGGWSLRSSIVRYAQPEPGRASRILDGVRRLDAALHQHAGLLQAEGPAVWDALEGVGGEEPDAAHQPLVDLLRVAVRLDQLGDLLAEWAVARSVPRPDADVDAITSEVADRLDALGVAPDGPPPRPVPNGTRGRRRS